MGATRHCEFRAGLRPVPLDEAGHPLFHTLRPPFAGRTAALLLLFPTPGLLRNFAPRNFAPRNDDPARSEAAGGRSQRWRNKGALQAFSKLLQNSRVLLQSFSKQIFWRFCGIAMGYKFSKRPLMLSKFFASGRPLFAALPDLTIYFSRWLVSSRSSDPDRENFEPNKQSGFWEEISVILLSRHWQVPHRPPASPLG